MELFTLTLVIYISWIGCKANDVPIPNLRHYETLHHRQLNHRIVRRSTEREEKHVQFDSLGKQFDLRLTRKSGLLSPDFRVVAIDGNNMEREVDIDTGNLYHGVDANEANSYVQAYFEDDNIVANIETGNETYVVEPSWRQLPDSQNHSMIAYRKSDLDMEKDLGKSYCGYVHPDSDEASYESVNTEPFRESNFTIPDAKRSKRQASSQSSFTPTRNSCPLLLVADYRFFKNMGQGSLSKTTSYLIGLIHRVDKIYRQTDFGNGYINMGFEIKEMRIHEDPTVTTGGEEHYNDERESWDTKPLLEAFSRDSRNQQFCLAHLFTYLPFEGSVLGLANPASYRTYSPGGICSPPYYKGGYQLFLNTGWSSSLNRYKRRLLTSEADLVTTHEFGHNWGSEHDPDTSECSPGSSKGGKHIMYTYSVSGFDPNNRVFSNCSQRLIGAVLNSKSNKCFTELETTKLIYGGDSSVRGDGGGRGCEVRADATCTIPEHKACKNCWHSKVPQVAFCGNSNVEEGEECDAGPATKKGTHPCCNKYCLLQPNAKCSDTNDVCCSSCQYTPAGEMCYEDGPCEAQSNCTGDDKACPAPNAKDDKTECLTKGMCMAGVCLPFCESINKISCICDNVTDSCKWCCKDNSTSLCTPHIEDGTTSNLLKGMPCVQGYCNEGVCEKQVQDLVERFWDVIVNLNPSFLVAFMRANIVGTVIVLSLIIWIPASCAIHHVDKKKQKKDEAHREWMRADNEDMILPDDKDRVYFSTSRARHVPSNVVRSSYKC